MLKNQGIMYYPLFLFPVLFFLAVFQADPRLSLAQEKQEETYSISLVQAAEADKQVKEIDGRKVITEPYEVKSGDHLWKILREKGLLKNKRDLREVLELLKRLNSSLANIDLLHPGETILIPLVLAPVRDQQSTAKPKEPPLPLANLNEADVEYYTIQPGDSLVKVLKNKFNLSDKEIHDEFLSMLKKLNPGLENPNRVFPGQKIRLPIYSPQVVRMPLPPPPLPEEAAEEAPKEESFPYTAQVGAVFKEMGFEWVDAGQHFIPLKSGGQINLNADSFPIVNLPNGNRIIIDSKGGLPEKMGRLITSSWENYRIVRLRAGESLREAIGKILSACGYPKTGRDGGAIELPGSVSLHLKGDWILQIPEEDQTRKGRTVVLRLLEKDSARSPDSFKRLLEEIGVKIVEFPPSEQAAQAPLQKGEVLKSGSRAPDVVQTTLQLTGVSFTRDVEISVLQSRKEEFSLLIKADFLLRKDGREKIIDFSGLGTEIVSLLREHEFEVLRLYDRQDPVSVISGVLDFASIPFDPNPHTFFATEENGSAGTSLTVPCVTFSAVDGRKILVPRIPFSEGLKSFVSEKGYSILEASQS